MKVDVIDFITQDEEFKDNDTMLHRKVNILSKKYGYLPADDLGIIRVIF